MPDNLIIIGNGGHTQDILGIVESNRWTGSSTFYHTTIIDDDPQKSDIEGTCIEDMYLRFISLYGNAQYVIGVNDSQIRAAIAARMDKLYAYPVAPLVHPSAVIMVDKSDIGVGCVIGPNVVITRNVKLGIHSHINSCASINQGSTVGSFATMAPGARICGDVNVGDRVGFGCNSSVINMINIGNDVFVGAGAVVIRDISDGQTVVGVPAKPLIKGRKNENVLDA